MTDRPNIQASLSGVPAVEILSEIAIRRLRDHEPPEGYYLAFSGGKDSIVIYDLAVRAGVRFDAHYSQTTVDPPEVVQFILSQSDYQLLRTHPRCTPAHLAVHPGTREAVA